MVINISNQQQNASLNEILSKQNSTKPNKLILVKNDGILTGIDAFPTPFPQRPRGRTTNGIDIGKSNPDSNPTSRFPHQPSSKNQNNKKKKKVKILDESVRNE